MLVPDENSFGSLTRKKKLFEGIKEGESKKYFSSKGQIKVTELSPDRSKQGTAYHQITEYSAIIRIAHKAYCLQ